MIRGWLIRILTDFLQTAEARDQIDQILERRFQDFQDRLQERLSTSIENSLSQSLDNQAVKDKIWIAANRRNPKMPWFRHRPFDLGDKMHELAAEQTARFIMANMANAKNTQSQLENLTYAISKARTDGLFLEFGVFEGSTVNHISSAVGQDATVHGFDSFEGLPTDWFWGFPKGAFSTEGAIPEVNSNVRLHVGWFHATLPEFLKEYGGDVAFLHVDSDVYESAKVVLDLLEDRIVEGTVIVFDEFFNYPLFEDHEYRAFFEFIAKTGKRFEYLSYVEKGFSVCVRITA